MLRILGSKKRLCNGVTRRDLLVAGGVGALGAFAGLPTTVAASSAAPAPTAKAKACILLYLYGSPSQLETFDMKPDAPAEIRGEMKPMRSSLPGCDVCELMPNTARIMDKVTVVRSLHHQYPIHGVAFATTGIPKIDLAMELNPRDARHRPFIGSVVDYLDERRRGGAAAAVPANMALPFPFGSRRTGEVFRAGPYAAFLGGQYDPVWTETFGEPTARGVYSVLGNKPEDLNPYRGVGNDLKFGLSAAGLPEGEIVLDRMNRRRGLLSQMDVARADLERTVAGRSLERFRGAAHALLGSPKVRNALDISREPAKLREAYGATLFGQATVAARRLVEAGSRFVTVFWDEYGLAGSGWDTHSTHFPRMRDELLPGFDKAFAALISDLDARGMLDSTLVMVLSEHGRTPKVQNVPGGGRDHWSNAYSAAFAGGGVARGRVIGRTDRIAGEPTDRPVSPKDVLATAIHLMGFDRNAELIDRTGRPFPAVEEGNVVAEMLG
jgi:hypothetical protein